MKLNIVDLALILYIVLACGLTLISIFIVKTIIKPFCKRFLLLVLHEKVLYLFDYVWE